MPGYAWLQTLEPQQMDWFFLGSPLLLAVMSGDERKVDALLAGGMTPDERRTPEGRTALWLAVTKGNFITVESLLQKGADPTIEDIRGFSAITRAAELGYQQCLHMFASYCPGCFECPSALLGLYFAAANGEVMAVRALLGLGVKANARLPDSPPVTHMALTRYTDNPIAPAACIMEFIVAGADLTATDNKGRTVLHVAALANDTESVKLLLEHRAPRNIPDNDGKIPIDLAKTDEVRDLLEIYTPASSTTMSLTESSSNLEHSEDYATSSGCSGYSGYSDP